ncbi:hypothetical protein DVR12_19980 [Chitinophaga silvatica]|uniref:Lipoprotein n=1 Tax=Chitinophaga silvatica TaxID=2282649 RepID=A0A3E1Y633_9BACT|nr:hypothetical protein [Chitinophaga silvatica]RFS20007.1 hypothetical protein DVR12_19980 [Chitinophaga silvatica]
MYFGKCLSFTIISLSLISCWEGKQLSSPDYSKHPTLIDSSKLRFDGYYTNISRPDHLNDKYPAVNPVFFTRNNKIYVSHGSNTDSALFTCSFYKKLNPADLGVYVIEGNRISAFVRVAVSMGEGAWYGLYNLHFSGTIVNRELIKNWKAVPPFPKRIKKRDFENTQNVGIFEEHDLKFIQADSIRCLNPL